MNDQRFTVFRAIAVCSILNFVTVCAAPQDSVITKAISDLGESDSSAIYQRLTLLESNPELSVRLLIDQLQPISHPTRIPPEEFSKHPTAYHIVWCVRALRYLTGLDFTAQTAYRFRRDESIRLQMVQSKRATCTFFGVHMAHDVIYLAPEDAQTAIIQKWHNWYDANRGKIKLDRSLKFNDWYF